MDNIEKLFLNPQIFETPFIQQFEFNIPQIRKLLSIAVMNCQKSQNGRIFWDEPPGFVTYTHIFPLPHNAT